LGRFTMTEADITRRIAELARERGGHISFHAFLDSTGVSRSWLRGQPWFRSWNELLNKLDLKTKSFGVSRIPSTAVAKSITNLIMRIERWPTDDDIRQERFNDPLFPSINVVRPIRKTGELARLIVAIGDSDPAYRKASNIARQQVQNISTEVHTLPDEKIRGYVYLLRSGRRYKIGKSNDPSRRYREVKLELPDETIQDHTIATDDPSGIEAYWHKRFASKRIRNTEFFNLDAADVRAFKRRSYQ
jgi:Meiotically up-regulated gene 113